MHTAKRSRYLEAVDAALEGATVVTVNTRAARHVIAGCDRRRVQSGASAWTTPDVLPFASWLQRTFRSAQLSGATSAVLLNRLQWRKLWERVMWDSTRASELLRPTIAADAAIEAWSLLHAYGIRLSDSAFNVTSESRQFRQWARAVSRECETSGWLDESRIPESLASVLARVGHAVPAKLVVYGFDALTPQYLAFLNALRAHGVAVEGDSHREDSEIPDTSVRIDLPDGRSELTTAAAWARGVLSENPEANIGVVIPDLASLRSAAEHVFSLTLHPAVVVADSGERAFEISVGLSLADWPLTRTALQALRFSADGLPFTELRELLLSPYLAGAVFEASARAQLVRELAAIASEHVTRRDLQSLLSHKKLRAIDCPMLRAQLERFRRACDRTADKAPFSAWTRLATESLEALGWPGIRDGIRSLDSTEYQVFNRWNDLLSEITSMDVIHGEVRFADAVGEILRVAAGAVFAP
ncbi:MAG TPA: hypothetical protein VEG32_11925, partial [Clostridia bacterium]|nr:hypothetical protein [Clostridia bacterium]